MVNRDTLHPSETADELKAMAAGPARRPLRCRVRRTAKAPTETRPPSVVEDLAHLLRTLAHRD
jgi:hypothetical protein